MFVVQISTATAYPLLQIKHRFEVITGYPFASIITFLLTLGNNLHQQHNVLAMRNSDSK